MENQHSPKLTSSEISSLWMSYQNDTMAICGIEYFLANIDDEAIRSLLEYALDMSRKHVQKETELFEAENYPVPIGFTEHDVNLDAPRLFSDTLYLHYMLYMGEFGMVAYTSALAFAERDDIINYFTDCISEVNKLHNWAKRLAKEMGIYLRSPYLPTPEQVDFVKKQNFLSAGWIGDKRPLLGIEAAYLHYNAKRNAFGQALITGLSQVVQDKEARRYFERGRDLAGKQVEVFSSLLHDNDLPAMRNLTSEVTDSTTAPFSDKLMMYHVTALIGSTIGQYGLSMAQSLRRDVGVDYARLVAEVAKYSEDGANIMINHGWMEQPPEAADRKALAKKE